MTDFMNAYNPDFVSPPGDTLLELIDHRGMSQDQLAVRIGLTRKHINRIIAGDAPITPETALRLERALGVPARFWNNREQQYRDALARRVEEDLLRSQVAWLQHFPVRRMIQLGWLEASADKVEQLRRMLDFFGVASPDTWHEYWDALQVAYRKSAKLQADAYALAAWLRKGELVGQGISCAPYDGARFSAVISEIRSLTTTAPQVFQPKLIEACAACGVAVAFVPELPRTASGATRWLAPDKALVQLSLRYKTDDHLWFTFFHEAAHILLHRKKAIFIESEDHTGADEDEANEFAAHKLIPPDELGAFIRAKRFSEANVRAFAARQGIAPGIVVGQLQHRKAIPFSYLNRLKQTFRWV